MITTERDSTNRDTANRDPANRAPSTSARRADPERQHIASCVAAVHHLPAGPAPPLGLPAPAPERVQEARAYLTPLHATGVNEVLWEARKRPMPDGDAIDAVNAASDQAQRGAGDHPEPVEVAAALVVLSAVRLNLDQTEARLLNTAQASGMSFEQIAAILDLSAETTQERYRQLKPRLDEPAAPPPPPLPSRTTARIEPANRLRRPTTDPRTWDELDDDDWGTPIPAAGSTCRPARFGPAVRPCAGSSPPADVTGGRRAPGDPIDRPEAGCTR